MAETLALLFVLFMFLPLMGIIIIPGLQLAGVLCEMGFLFICACGLVGITLHLLEKKTTPEQRYARNLKETRDKLKLERDLLYLRHEVNRLKGGDKGVKTNS